MMRRILFSLITLFAIAACSQESPVVSNDVDTFSRQLVGQWELATVDITPVHAGKSIDLAPSKEYACNQLSTAFESKDVVSKFSIRFQDGMVKVSKFYTCSLPPEQLSWKIELDNIVDQNVNWVNGKTFTINEVNEAEVQATYKLLFFNLDSNSPTGEVCTKFTANQLWLDVKYDTKRVRSILHPEDEKGAVRGDQLSACTGKLRNTQSTDNMSTLLRRPPQEGSLFANK